MAVARQVELFENAFNKAKENGGIWLEMMVVKLRGYI